MTGGVWDCPVLARMLVIGCHGCRMPRMPRRFSDAAGFGSLGPLRMEGGTPRRTGTMVGCGFKDWERASVRAFSCGEGGGRKGRPYILIFVAKAKVGPREG